MTSTSPARPIPAVFLGTGAFAVPILDALRAHPEVAVRAVVTAPPARSGRGGREAGSPVHEAADAAGLQVLTPPRLRAPDAVAAVAALAPELIVLADYGQIVPVQLLELPRHGALNIHPSLLPRHRGASPVAAAILHADRETGVTLMQMDHGLDTGPLIAQRRVPLDGTENAPDLERRLAGLGAALLSETLAGWLAGRLPAIAQPAEGATLTRPLRREDGRLDPARSAVELERQIRAYQPWPGSFIDTPVGRLVAWRAEVERPARRGGADVGTIIAIRGPEGAPEPSLVTADGVLRLTEVQPAGGRRMSGAELLRGRSALVGARAVPATASQQTLRSGQG